MASRPSLHAYDTLDGEDEVIGVGLGCNGRIEVLFLPLEYHDPDNEVELLRSVVNTRRSLVLTRSLGGGTAPSYPTPHLRPRLPQLAAALDLLPAQLAQLADEHLAAGRSRVVKLIAADGTTQPVLFEVVHPEIHLVLTGTNYDIPAALRAAGHLGWRTTVVGARRKLTGDIAALANRLLDYSEVASCTIDAATAVVLMSHDYAWDGRMVRHFLPLRPTYLGMLGPRKRVVSMATDLELPELLTYPNLYAPVGLDIGAETPEEIATSLVSEIVMAFRGRSGRALRERSGSIH